MTTYPSPPTQHLSASRDSRPAAPSHWGTRRVLAAVTGCLLLFAALAMGTAGAMVVLANSIHRDADGYLISSPVGVTTSGYALTSANLQIQSAVDLPHQILGNGKVMITPRGETPVFVGVARTSDVSGYLSSVRRTQVTAFGEAPVYQQLGDGSPSAAPTDVHFWVAQAAGTGSQSVTWPVENGDWTIVVMNADGSSGVSGDLAAGATVPAMDWIYGGLFTGTIVFLVIGALLLVAAMKRTESPAQLKPNLASRTGPGSNPSV